MDELSDIEWLDEMLKNLSVNGIHYDGFILDTPYYDKVVECIQIIKDVFDGCEIKVKVAEPIPQWISVEVVDSFLNIKKVADIISVIRTASCVDAWAKLNGDTVLAFSFNSIMVPYIE